MAATAVVVLPELVAIGVATNSVAAEVVKVAAAVAELVAVIVATVIVKAI